MALYNVMLLGELFFSLWSSKTMFKLMTCVNMYCIAFDCYTAFFTMGLFAYSIVLLANLPYLVALAALMMRPQSVSRRRVIYQVCKLVYAFKFVSDLWCAVNIGPDIQDICEAVVYQEPYVFEAIQAQFPGVMQRSEITVWMLSVCRLKFTLQRVFSQLFLPNLYSFTYLGVIKRYWKRLVDQRLKAERKRISKIWKKMLENKRSSIERGGIDFMPMEFPAQLGSDDGDGGSGGLGTSSKQFIKLPKHYEPSLINKIY